MGHYYAGNNIASAEKTNHTKKMKKMRNKYLVWCYSMVGADP